MLHRLNHRHLVFFRALAESLSFTAAAESCGVSQPGLSAAIRELEAELGVQLFHRTTRNVSLTADGAALLPLVRTTLINALQAERDIRDLVRTRRTNLRIAAVSSITSYLLPAILAHYAPENPLVRIEMMDLESPEVTDFVFEGQAEIGLGLGPYDPEAFEREALFSDPLCVVMTRDHPLADRSQITWEDIADHPVITYRSGSDIYAMIERTMALKGIRFAPEGTFRFRQTVFGMVMTGHVIAILPALSLERTMPHGLVHVHLSEPTVSRQYYLITRKGRSEKEGVRKLIAYLCNELKGWPAAGFVDTKTGPRSMDGA